jgi:V8-like Glu-specific endopeptidase
MAAASARIASFRALALGSLAAAMGGSLQSWSGDAWSSGALRSPVSSTATAPAIYGTDDRLDVFEAADPALRALAVEGVGALVFQNNVALDGSDTATWRAPSLWRRTGVCQGERFSGQPSLANCSAVLVDDDVVLTAGHCLGSRADMSNVCRDTLVLFGFAYSNGPEVERMTAARVFACKRVLAFSFDEGDSDVADFAALLLDRSTAATMQRPVAIAAGDAVGQRVHLVGNGAGLPTKIDSGGAIAPGPTSENFFAATTDSFAGGSGSGIFDDDLRLIGIQSRGQSDWMVSPTEDCLIAASAASGYETHQYAGRAVEALCASGWRSERLCGTKPVCGDGVCGVGERDVCTADCPDLSCGDGVCSLEERATCELDCGWLSALPSGWTCAPRDYGDGATCDCGCGAPDPDCSSRKTTTVGCDWGESCSPSGTCEPRPVPESAPSTSSGGCAVAPARWASGSRTARWAYLALVAALVCIRGRCRDLAHVR